MTGWSVRLTVQGPPLAPGSRTWETSSTDTQAGYGLVSPLSASVSALDDRWPPVPAPVEVKASIVAPDFTSVPMLRLGALVNLVLTFTDGNAGAESFAGRIAEVTAAPHPLGVVFSFTALDLTADLRSKTARLSPSWPDETIFARIQRVMGQHYAGGMRTDSGASGYHADLVPFVSAVPADATLDVNLYDYVTELLSWWAPNRGLGPERLALYPSRLSGNTVLDWDLTGFPKFPAPALHLRLAYFTSSGLWRVVASPNPADRHGWLPARALLTDAAWAETKDDAYTATTVTREDELLPPVTIVAPNTPDPVVLTIPTSLLSVGNMGLVANLYTPTRSAVIGWQAEAFTYVADLDSPGIAPVEPLGAVMVVGGALGKWQPGGRTYWTGRLAAREWTLADGKLTASLQLRQPDYRARDAASWDAAVLNGTNKPRWVSLDRAVTWDDLRMMRGTTS